MKKKCIICTHYAEYRIKDTADFYCQECAEENFGDLTLLLPLVDDTSSPPPTIDENTLALQSTSTLKHLPDDAIEL
ncbi:hypothetical protein HYX13_04605 [Candidatus Woesearchaeota archaeon]|nr:hypothetical protein [Candidatus Woesearchaeota archaeon]